MENGKWKVIYGKWIRVVWIFAAVYFPLSTFCFLAGCATPGPKIPREEIEAARKVLQAKAFRYKFSQQIRLNQLGRRLMIHLPTPEDNRPKPYTGLLISDVNKQLQEFYRLSSRHGIVVIGVVPESPAQKAGFKEGDLILKIGKAKPRSAWEAHQSLRKLKLEEATPVELSGEEGTVAVELIPDALPYSIQFLTVESEEVNAFASPEQIVVTYGMLRFIQSDEELAVVVGHELAHLTEGHIAKSMGSGLLSGILGLTIGIGAEILLPGSGDPMSRLGGGALQAQFSKEFEREADYIGLQYVHAAGFDIRAGIAVWERFGVEIPQSLSSNFLSTHPPSPERMVRVQKVVDEIENTPPIQSN
ncbi:MAG: M48 family metalloprotease [Candidatus Omnitrophica bacterium]|nr:M48 family metalloprotease [Candidatus Omnitrophota bacterium]